MKPLPILLLHGALGNQNELETIEEELLRKDFNVIKLNFYGHGNSLSKQDFSIAGFTQQLISFLNDREIDKAILFGHSMGGYVALNTALNYPNRVKQVITLGTKMDWSIEATEKELKMLNPDNMLEKVPQYIERLKREHAMDWRTMLAKTTEMMKRLSSQEQLTESHFKNISSPVVIGLGSKDNMVSIEESKEAVECLPHGTFYLLEGVYHPLAKNDPIILANHIIKALKMYL